MPSTFVRSVPAGSSQDRWTLDCPARWRIRSGRTSSTTAAAAAGSVRSASIDARPRGRAPRHPSVGQHHSVDLDLGVLRVQEVHEVAAHEAPGTGDEEPHRYAPRPCRLPAASTPWKLPIDPMLASSRLKRHCTSSRPFQL